MEVNKRTFAEKSKGISVVYKVFTHSPTLLRTPGRSDLLASMDMRKMDALLKCDVKYGKVPNLCSVYLHIFEKRYIKFMTCILSILIFMYLI